MLKQVVKRIVAVAAMTTIVAFGSEAAFAEQTKLSNGVTYEQTETTYNGKPQVMNELTVDLKDPYTEVRVHYPFDKNMPNKLGRLKATTLQANSYTKVGQRVVGAVNGSYFWGSEQHYLPMHLIAENDELLNAGIVSSDREGYVAEPIAFGIDKNGKALVAPYELTLQMEYDGITYDVTSTDKNRTENDLILYTPRFAKDQTETNELGVELILESLEPSHDTTLQFGQTVRAKVIGKRERNDKYAPNIPSVGYVLSGHGTQATLLKNIPKGAVLTFRTDVDPKWRGASFMLAAGPYLLENGEFRSNIDNKGTRWTQRAPRTLVGVRNDGQTVQLLTVDGRQTKSEGMTFKEVATYYKNKGIEHLLSLDGGGSTTMAIRPRGMETVVLANRPSGGTERAVSTTLFALSTAPTGTLQEVIVALEREGTYVKGAKGKVEIRGGLDEYGNPVPFQSSDVQLNGKPIGDGTFDTSQFVDTPLQITANGKNVATLPLTVVDGPKTLTLQMPKTLKKGEKVAIDVVAQDDKGKPVIYDRAQLQLTASNANVRIHPNGTLEAIQKGQTVIKATLGTTNVTYTVTVTDGTVNEKPTIPSKPEKPKAHPVGEATNDRLLDDFNQNQWTTSSVRGKGALVPYTKKAPSFDGKGALGLTYDHRQTSGTSATYIAPNRPFPLGKDAKTVTLRLFGDKSQLWVRGTVQNEAGETATINFTENKGLTWNGWNYVVATLPNTKDTWTLTQVYVTQPTDSLKTTGTLWFDQLKVSTHKVPNEGLFHDTSVQFRTESEIRTLVQGGVISGFPSGHFKPYTDLTRQQAAILIARALQLDVSDVKDPQFTDMAPTMTFYKEVAAVTEAGIIRGKEGGKMFDPNGKLTRAEMAAILQRAFSLKGDGQSYFTDTKGSFAHDAINALAANDITQGVGHGKFDTTSPISRSDFSVFLYRALY